MMKKEILLVLSLLVLAGCVTKPQSSDLDFDDVKSAQTKKQEKQEPVKTSGIVVGPKELQLLDKMNKAVESYVLKNEKAQFNKLCKDKRFDCFVDEKMYPTKKKKISRAVPPYASGSKMGLQGEQRVHVKYDFYP